MDKEKKVHEPLFQIVKHATLPKKKAIGYRAVTVLIGFLLIFIVSWIVLGVDPINFFLYMIKGNFSSSTRVLALLRNIAILLLISIALAPAFKMKFWNIGAEGQVLMGGFATVACMYKLGGIVPEPLLILIMFISAIVVGGIWALIPALFKAKWNTNETLFTLMMNYIATQVVLYYIKVWVTSGSGTLPQQKFGRLPIIGGDVAWLVVIVAVVATALMYVYLKFTKHGFEIGVVGESESTARYIGINVKKVIIRTMLLSGVICGLVGFLIVGGIDYSISKDTVCGNGFTAILVCWLSHFDPFIMVLISLLVVFLSKGTSQVMTEIGMTNTFFANATIGIIFLVIIAGEFFITYSLKSKKLNEFLSGIWKKITAFLKKIFAKKEVD